MSTLTDLHDKQTPKRLRRKAEHMAKHYDGMTRSGPATLNLGHAQCSIEDAWKLESLCIQQRVDRIGTVCPEEL
jgi:hypothetical protein